MVKNRKHTMQPIQKARRKSNAHYGVLLLLAWFNLLTPMLSLPLAHGDEKGPNREESQFDIYVDGKEIGYEKFSILTSADAVGSKSVVSFRDPGKTHKKVEMETELTTDSSFLPRAYQLRSDVEGLKGTITGSFAPREATFEYRGSGNPIRRGLLVGDRYVILDTNVFHHFIFVARLYDMHAGGVQQIEAVIPQELEGGKLKVSETGLEIVTIRGKKMTLHHLTADSGMLLIDLWIDDQKILYKISLPAKKVEAIRAR
jgi:hypothetical protein